MNSTFIPIEFQKIRDKTLQSFIRIKAKYTDLPSSVLASKFGGTAYLVDGDYPEDKLGNKMALLAQINFSELNKFDESRIFPEQGMLQFFLPINDELYGADFEPPNLSEADFTVRFIEFLPDDEKKITAIALDEETLFPVYGEHLLNFSEEKGFAGMTSIECQIAAAHHPFELLEDVSLDEQEESTFYDNIEKKAKSQGHKLLGYPYFTQTDPRENANYRLLLQIDTDMIDDNDIMWGDSGVAQFFISNEDLEKRDFSNLWFNWDCF